MGVAEPQETRNILSGTAQNVVGIVIAAAATFAANILIGQVLGRSAFGLVTVVTQGAFVLSFATRAGMDMAVLRDVAIKLGQGSSDAVRSSVSRAVAIAAAVSTAIAALVVVGAGVVRDLFSIDESAGRYVVEAAALGLPFLAVTNVWLSATRGLKIMRYTLYIFWAGQPLLWVALMVAGWQLSESAWMAVLTYSLSWAVAAVFAYGAWRKESRAWVRAPMAAGEMSRMMRYAGPRAPAALFSQLLFWTDLFVLTRYASDAELGVYAAALRAGQVIVLFLTSVSLMFSPYVADLHARGETARLDRLFKNLTRWTLAATLPLFIVLAVMPDEALKLFGSGFSGGQVALLILVAGQLVNVATGSVGFVLIMVGRTGWDLAVYAGSLVLNVGLALWLCPRYGMEGAAVANAVTFAASKWVRLVLVRISVAIQPYDRRYGRLVLPAVAGAVVTWGVHALSSPGLLTALLLPAVAGTVAYAVVYLMAGLTEEERSGVRRLLDGKRMGAAHG